MTTSRSLRLYHSTESDPESCAHTTGRKLRQHRNRDHGRAEREHGRKIAEGALQQSQIPLRLYPR